MLKTLYMYLARVSNEDCRLQSGTHMEKMSARLVAKALLDHMHVLANSSRI